MIQKKLTDAIAANDTETKMWKSRFAAAKAAYSAGEFRQCESLLYRALEQAKTLEEYAFAANTCHIGLGALYIATGKLDQAQEHLTEAINALSGSGNAALKELYAVALRFQSTLLSETGDYEIAEDHLQKAIEVLNDVGTEGAVQLAYTMSDLATLYVMQGDIKESKELLFSAMEILEATLGAEHTEYIRANIIYNISDTKDEDKVLEDIADSIFRAQYHRGQNHPNIIRGLRWYLKKLKERGDDDKITEAKERFNLHTKALGS